MYSRPSKTSSFINESMDNLSVQEIYTIIEEQISELDIKTNLDPNEMMKNMSAILENTEYLIQQTSIKEKASNTVEIVQDSKILRSASDQVVRCSKTIAQNVNTYDRLELARHIASNSHYWTFTFPYEVHSMTYLFGTFDPEKRARQSIVRSTQSQRQKVAVAAPKLLDRTIELSQNNKSLDAEKIYNALKKECKDDTVSYFHVVLDPQSFSKTIENIFQVSFLANEQKIEIVLDKSELPCIKLLSPNKRRKTEDGESNHFVVSMDKTRWQELNELFGITERFLKT